MTWRQLPGLDRRARRRVLVAVGVGLTGELGALGLLATGAWLLLSTSLRPPILLLSIAIGAVQLFSFLRGSARYAERLASHNLGLGLQAGVRSWLYRRLEQLLPAGLPGGDRGDLLARLIGDTEEAQDLVVRAAVPVLAAAVLATAGVTVTVILADRKAAALPAARAAVGSWVLAAAAAWCAAVVTAAFLLPAAGWAILAAGVLATAGVTVTVILADRKAAALPAARAAVGSWVLGSLTSAEELAALGAGEWALAELASASACSAPAPGPSPPPSDWGGGLRTRRGHRAGRGRLGGRSGRAGRADQPRRARRPGLPGPSLDTVLAPWGHPVSGGELQRLSVARAMLADRPVLLLDEPTSHLDAATADAVLTVVLERAADRSVLWVTHRPEELARFPEVLSLKTPLGWDSW